MKILSHRGVWSEIGEQNKIEAFHRSLELGFGIELDLRDFCGEVVISHDPPSGGEISLNDFLVFICDTIKAKNLKLALNVKSDGLANKISNSLKNFPDIDYFTFDMSIPDMKNYLENNLNVFGRVSEVEKEVPWLDRLSGIWIDCFYSDWFGIDDVQLYLNQGKEVCLVSPELHGRDYHDFWKKIVYLKNQENLFLCTDFPSEAKSFFGDDNG